MFQTGQVVQLTDSYRQWRERQCEQHGEVFAWRFGQRNPIGYVAEITQKDVMVILMGKDEGRRLRVPAHRIPEWLKDTPVPHEEVPAPVKRGRPAERKNSKRPPTKARARVIVPAQAGDVILFTPVFLDWWTRYWKRPLEEVLLRPMTITYIDVGIVEVQHDRYGKKVYFPTEKFNEYAQKVEE